MATTPPPTEQQQVQDRIKKLERLRALGVDPYGGKYPGTTALRDLKAAGEALPLEPGGEPDAISRRGAGRIVLFRDMGKLIFLTLRDDSGDLQVAISRKSVPDAEWQVCKLLDLGDIIGVHGVLGRTRTGELTLWARPPEDPAAVAAVTEADAYDLASRKASGEESAADVPAVGRSAPAARPLDRAAVALLCKSLVPPPAKDAAGGFADTDLRYRQRYVDLYANPPVLATFQKRSLLIKSFRDYLTAPASLAHPYGGFLEVETPMLQGVYGGAAARPFTTHHNALGLDLFLRISPETYLKRLMVGGMGRVFEINRNFRNEGISTRHNPEFTMMELYMAYGDYSDMMAITEQLISRACRALNDNRTTVTWNGRELDFAPPWPRLAYADLFRQHVGCDMFHAEQVRLAAEKKFGTACDAKGKLKDDAVLVGELFEACVEPELGKLSRPVFVLDYPAPLCPLTRRHGEDPRIALRFEAYVAGMEIANAYSELNDPAIQEENFRQQLAGEGDETMRVADDDFINALRVGMPPAGGLGIGIDRVVMLLTNSPSIRDVILFPLNRPLDKGHKTEATD